jgi:hypothetical protein
VRHTKMASLCSLGKASSWPEPGSMHENAHAVKCTSAPQVRVPIGTLCMCSLCYWGQTVCQESCQPSCPPQVRQPGYTA